jgi:hypothetical protein
MRFRDRAKMLYISMPRFPRSNGSASPAGRIDRTEARRCSACNASRSQTLSLDRHRPRRHGIFLHTLIEDSHTVIVTPMVATRGKVEKPVTTC